MMIINLCATQMTSNYLNNSVPTPPKTSCASHIRHMISQTALFFFSMAQQPPSGPELPQNRGFTITLRHTTLGRTPPEEGPARLSELYLTSQNTHKRQTKCYRRDSNPQSQQVRGRRPTPQTARSLGPKSSVGSVSIYVA
jgi:hypothetical protein